MIYMAENISSALFGVMLVISIVFVIFEVFNDEQRHSDKKDS